MSSVPMLPRKCTIMTSPANLACLSIFQVVLAPTTFLRTKTHANHFVGTFKTSSIVGLLEKYTAFKKFFPHPILNAVKLSNLISRCVGGAKPLTSIKRGLFNLALALCVLIFNKTCHWTVDTSCGLWSKIEGLEIWDVRLLCPMSFCWKLARLKCI